MYRQAHTGAAAAAPTLPLDVLLSMIPSLPRAALDRLTERMIDRMDEMDGDLDVEPNGDELDGHLGDDDFGMRWTADGAPGTPDDAEDDDPAECEARDDGCGPIGFCGTVLWGSWDDFAG